jgi:hypothetical protein
MLFDSLNAMKSKHVYFLSGSEGVETVMTRSGPRIVGCTIRNSLKGTYAFIIIIGHENITYQTSFLTFHLSNFTLHPLISQHVIITLLSLTVQCKGTHSVNLQLQL